MDWIGFDWNCDGHVSFEESMMTFIAASVFQLDTENQLLRQKIRAMEDTADPPISLDYPVPRYRHRRKVNRRHFFKGIIKFFLRIVVFPFKAFYYLATSIFLGWRLIFHSLGTHLTKTKREMRLSGLQVAIIICLFLLDILFLLAIVVLLVSANSFM